MSSEPVGVAFSNLRHLGYSPLLGHLLKSSAYARSATQLKITSLSLFQASWWGNRGRMPCAEIASDFPPGRALSLDLWISNGSPVPCSIFEENHYLPTHNILLKYHFAHIKRLSLPSLAAKPSFIRPTPAAAQCLRSSSSWEQREREREGRERAFGPPPTIDPRIGGFSIL